MKSELDVQWFDNIYESGDKPSLEQRAALSAHVQLHFPERTKREVAEQLKDYLFRLKQGGGYSKGLQALAYDLMIGILPKISGNDLSEVNGYIAQYRAAVARHREESPLAANFR